MAGFKVTLYFILINLPRAEYGYSVQDVRLTLIGCVVLQAASPLFFSHASHKAGHQPISLVVFFTYTAINPGLAPDYRYFAILLLLAASPSLGGSATITPAHAQS